MHYNKVTKVYTVIKPRRKRNGMVAGKLRMSFSKSVLATDAFGNLRLAIYICQGTARFGAGLDGSARWRVERATYWGLAGDLRMPSRTVPHGLKHGRDFLVRRGSSRHHLEGRAPSIGAAPLLRSSVGNRWESRSLKLGLH
jgi:hypothetical protein